MATNKRTRTGCRTCRTRKLKCDEDRPICGQCRKSNRECIASEGVTFRHAQNAAVNSADELGSFYKYRQKYNSDHFFLPIPREHPYEDELLTSPSANYQQVAAHTLEALSTAATGDQPTTNQPSYTDFTTGYVQMPHKRSVAHAQQLRLDSQNNDINFLLNPSNTPSAMIDPNLEAVTGHHMSQEDMQDGTRSMVVGMNGQDMKNSLIDNIRDDDNIFDNQILAALQQTAEAAVEHNVQHV